MPFVQGHVTFDKVGTRIHTQIFFQQYQLQGNEKHDHHVLIYKLSASVVFFCHHHMFIGSELRKVPIAVSDELDNFTFIVTSNSNLFPGKIRQKCYH